MRQSGYLVARLRVAVLLGAVGYLVGEWSVVVSRVFVTFGSSLLEKEVRVGFQLRNVYLHPYRSSQG